MGFLKNMFSGESKEEKQFWSAYKDCFKKPNKKNLEKLDAAMQAFLSPWHGYFLKSLCHGVGTEQIKYDPQLAAEMQLKAQDAAKGTDAESWVNEFYVWFEKDAYNLDKPYSESERKLRQAGIAAINMHRYEQPVVGAHDYKDDAKLWAGFFDQFHFYDDAHRGAVADAAVISQWFLDIAAVKGADRDELIQHTNAFLKVEKKMNKKHKDNFQRSLKGKEEKWTDYTDMCEYLIAYNLLHDGPYTIYEWDSVKEWGQATVGLEYLMWATQAGSAPAFHEVMEYARSSEDNMRHADNICQRKQLMQYEAWEISKMQKCVELEDNEAMRLGLKYYQECYGDK